MNRWTRSARPDAGRTTAGRPAVPGRRTLLGGVAGALALSCTLPQVAAADDTYWMPADEQLQLHGHGYGHGRGMSQYGAQGAALDGMSWQEILAFYYPGTSLGRAGGRMRVWITDDTTRGLRVSPARGLFLRDLADGETWPLEKPTPSTDRWELRVNARNEIFVEYRDDKGWHHWRVPGRRHLRGEGQFQAHEPLTLWLPSGGGEVPHRYRERLRTVQVSPGSRERNTVNVLRLDKYVRGVVASEMPASWAPAAVRAQATAARTYAVRQRAQHRGRSYHVDDTTSYQVYNGVEAEHPASNAAVRATARAIVTYGGEPALTEFSSSSGGWTAGSSLAYQRQREDPYDGWGGNPNHTWDEVVDVGGLESRYPGIGELAKIVVTERTGEGDWGGRVERATLVGSRGSTTVSGDDLRWAYGLRSTWFTAEDTPIIRRWERHGGSSSKVGVPLAAERARAGGAVQRFRSGRIYWHEQTGAHGLFGPILKRYRRVGGVTGRLGFPTTTVRSAGGAPNAVRAHFQHGRIYDSDVTAARELYGPILRRYDHLRGAGGRLGLPTTRIRSAGGAPNAVRAHFQDGRIYDSAVTRAREVYGPILRRYDRLHGAGGPLGLPKTGVRKVRGGLKSFFQHGWIRWDRSSNSTTVHRYRS